MFLKKSLIFMHCLNYCVCKRKTAKRERVAGYSFTGITSSCLKFFLQRSLFMKENPYIIKMLLHLLRPFFKM